MINAEHKLQILKENFEQVEGGTFREYVEACADSDPHFFHWLFDRADNLQNDFDSDLTEEQRQEFQEFLESL